MKSRIILAALAVAMFAGTAWSLESVEGDKLVGSHFTLNIISVQNPKTADMDSDTGRGNTIFVNAAGKSQINLVKSGEAGSAAELVDADEFAVLDKNATDNDGALFALPDTGLLPYNITTGAGQTDTVSDYSLYARPLGKPGGWSTIQTCAELLDSTFAGLLSGDLVEVLNDTCAFGDDAYASLEIVGSDVTFRTKGKTSFTNVTAQLLTIVFEVRVEVVIGEDADGNPITEIRTEYIRVPIFSDILENEFWEYTQGTDADGKPTPLKLLQIRIYPWGTDVSGWDLEEWK